MEINEVVAAMLAGAAGLEAVLIRLLFPRMLKKNPMVTTEMVKELSMICYGMALVLFIVAVIIYLLKPLGAVSN